MRKVVVLACLIVLALTMVSIALAQDAETVCTPDDWRAKIDAVSSSLSELSAGVADQETALQVLSIAEAAIHTVRTSCTGYVFTNEDYPNGIIGPVTFDGTLYQVTFSSMGGFAYFKMVGDEGGCSVVGVSTDLEGGEETDLWEPSGNCITLFEVNGPRDGQWTLTFERLR